MAGDVRVEGGPRGSGLINRNVLTAEGRTSIRLEPELWDGIREICRREGWTKFDLVSQACFRFPDRPRTSAVRTFLFIYFRELSVSSAAEI